MVTIEFLPFENGPPFSSLKVLLPFAATKSSSLASRYSLFSFFPLDLVPAPDRAVFADREEHPRVVEYIVNAFSIFRSSD